MGMHLTTSALNLRVWRDDHLGQMWRVAYNDGDGEMIVSFPDTAAMGDFIFEQLGINLEDIHTEQQPPMWY